MDEDQEDPVWLEIRTKALMAAIAMRPNGEVREVTDLAWKLAYWVRNGDLESD